jgi:hypothetical protein
LIVGDQPAATVDHTYTTLLYELPITLSGLLFAVVLLVALETGYRVGLAKRKQIKDAEAGGGGVVLTSMFATLSLILAFTYGFTINRYDHRREAVITEANALGTAFLRAGFIDGPEAVELREALLAYARTRVVFVEVNTLRADAVERSLVAQARLWPLIERIVKSKPRDPIEALLVESMNEVIDMDTSRLAASFDRLPQPVFWILVLVAAASVSVAGFNAGLGGFISRWRMSALTFVLAAVMLIIIDFDRPQDGLIRITQEPLRGAVANMERTLGIAAPTQ